MDDWNQKEKIKVIKFNRLTQVYIGGSKDIIGIKQVYDKKDNHELSCNRLKEKKNKLIKNLFLW